MKLAMLFHKKEMLTAISSVLATIESRLSPETSKIRYSRVAPPRTTPDFLGSCMVTATDSVRNLTYEMSECLLRFPIEHV